MGFGKILLALTDRPLTTQNELFVYLNRQVIPIVRALREAWNKAAWTSFDPVFEDPQAGLASLGNGTMSAQYRLVGDSVTVHFQIIWGASTTTGAATVLTVPLPDGLLPDTEAMLVVDGGILGQIYLAHGSEAVAFTGASREMFVASTIPTKVLWVIDLAPAPGDIVTLRIFDLPVKKA